MRLRFEYKTVTFLVHLPKQIVVALNEQGEAGWELVTIKESDNTYYFKRSIPEELDSGISGS